MATIPSFQHATPAYRTFCGPKALAALPRELDRLGARRAVIFGGPWLVALPDVLGAIESAVGQRLAGRFDDVQEHSPVPSVEAARALLDHRRPHEAEPFARRAVALDPSPENEELLQKVLDAAAQVPGSSAEERPAAELEPPPVDAPSAAPPAGLLSRLFRHRG